MSEHVHCFHGVVGADVCCLCGERPEGTATDPAAELRAEFLRLLTEDGETNDRRRKDFNQAIFDAERGHAIWNGTDLAMVVEKFDKAVKHIASKATARAIPEARDE